MHARFVLDPPNSLQKSITGGRSLADSYVANERIYDTSINYLFTRQDTPVDPTLELKLRETFDNQRNEEKRCHA